MGKLSTSQDVNEEPSKYQFEEHLSYVVFTDREIVVSTIFEFELKEIMNITKIPKIQKWTHKRGLS
jgi:hypothetical protein